MRSAILAVVLAFAVIGCDRTPEPPDPATAGPVPEAPPELADGEALFVTHCSACHGLGGRGSEQGPPLVHRVYEPSHHGDIAFEIAALRGVRAHHWRFGDMPPVEGVTQGDVQRITAYVRFLQREEGIF